VVIGGNGRAVIRCTVQLGKEWHSPVVPPERLDQGIDELQVHAQAASRAIAEIPVWLSIPTMMSRLAARYAASLEGHTNSAYTVIDVG
jgi:hypothetical protein